MIKDIENVSLLDILPPNILEDEQINAAAWSLDSELQKVTAAVQEVLFLPYLDILPERVLDLLAWQWHVDFYEPVGMDLGTKRRLIRQTIAWHRIKGTPAAVEEIVSAVFADAKVEEWYQYDGGAFTFRVVVEGKDAFDETRDISQLLAVVESSKNKRSHLEGGNQGDILIKMEESTDLPLGIASPVSNIREVRLEPLKQGICLPFGIGFLAEEECTGIRAAFPKSAHEGMFIGIRHSKLLPRSVRAQGGHIDIPDRMGDKHLELAFGTLLWMPSGAVQNRLPSGAGTGLFVALRVSPMAGNAVQAAPPGNTARDSLFVGLLHTALLPRHVNASGTLPPPEAFPQEGRLGIRVGMAVHGDPMREVLPTFPRGASARSFVGVLAGEVLWHVNSRKE